MAAGCYSESKVAGCTVLFRWPCMGRLPGLRFDQKDLLRVN